MTAEIDEVYREFKTTTSKPEAIRAFLSYAFQYWKKPSPKYVLLAGDTEIIPSYCVPSLYRNLQNCREDSIAIDDLFVINQYSASKTPQAAIGRFPVKNCTELSNIIQKTILYGKNLSRNNYRKDFLFIADEDSPEYFENGIFSLEEMLTIAGKRDKVIFFRTGSDHFGTRADMFNAIKEGTIFLVNYMEGIHYAWSRENIFTIDDVGSLEQNGLPFILTSVSCSQDFNVIEDSVIVEKLLKYPMGGAVATFASAGILDFNGGKKIMQSFYNQIIKNPTLNLGDIILNVKKSLITEETLMDSDCRRYTLLGDPLLKLPVNDWTGLSEEKKTFPKGYSLSQNYPNPFNPSTKIDYSVPVYSYVTLKIYDVQGKEVAMPVKEYKSPGKYTVSIDFSSPESSVYFYTLEADGYRETKKLTLIK